MSLMPFVQEKRITDCTSYLAHFFQYGCHGSTDTMKGVLCALRKKLPPGSRNNVLTYNRVTDFCEHHFHGNKLGNLTF